MSIKILEGDCLQTLSSLEEKSVNTCVTSPPYWGLRDYGEDNQLGQEETPEKFVQNLVKVFQEIRRVLRDDGTVWLNLGDTYCGTGHKGDTKDMLICGGKARNGQSFALNNKVEGFKSKDLIGIPWRVAFALQADGWYLRQDIIRHKPNPMPESVQDRCTKAHEYIFLLSKSLKYYYDNEAIKEEVQDWGTRKRSEGKYHNEGTGLQPHTALEKSYDFKNKRSVWTVTTKPYQEAHFATYPPELIKPCILAGCPEGGTVLDPFGGSGTTAQVANNLNRNAILCELNPQYVDIAKGRLHESLGMFMDLEVVK